MTLIIQYYHGNISKVIERYRARTHDLKKSNQLLYQLSHQDIKNINLIKIINILKKLEKFKMLKELEKLERVEKTLKLKKL